MIKILQLIFVFVFLLLFYGCQKEEPQIVPALNEILKFDPDEYRQELKFTLLQSDSLTYPGLKYLDTLKYFYSKRNYEPLFIKSFEEEEFAASVLMFFENAWEHGLNPLNYHYRIIAGEFLTATDTSAVVGRYKHLVNSELYIADAILKYSWHLRYGVINPVEIYPESYRMPLPDSLHRFLFKPLEQENIPEYLQSIQPKSKKYVKLQAALKNFYRLKDVKWHPVTINRRKLVPGDEDPSFINIAQRLITFGFLDTSAVKTRDFSNYDTSFVPAVKMFQKMQGLNPDGVIGATTVERLNIKPDDYINKIKLSLERFRWIDYSGTEEYIMVNIPDFNLYIIRNGAEIFSSRVCTGRKRSAYYDARYEIYKKSKNWKLKPEDWETPVLYSRISYMVLNPTWTVPENIVREEIAVGLRKDSLYLKKKDFKVLKGGVEIEYSAVKPAELIAEEIPYIIVQNPGYQNALGRIKFMFNNPFGIYLHDTPVRSAFSLDNRAVSHGCVRVEKPLALSEFLLNHQSKWNIDYLKAEIGSPVKDREKLREYWRVRNELRKNSSLGETTDIGLERKVPLYIDYYTAWVDKDGKINFRDDVYNKDKKLAEAMKGIK